MRVMYFAYEGFDSPNGTNHLAIKLIDYLLNEGFEVYLLSSHSRGVDLDIPKVLEDRFGLTYDIVPRKTVNKHNFINRYLTGIKYAYDCKRRWKKQIEKVDVIILQSTQTVYFSARLLKKYKKPILFNSYDVFPNVAYDCGAIKNKMIYSILRGMQRKVYSFCSDIIVISDDMRKTIINEGVKDSKITEIRNWYDSNAVKEVSNKDNKFVKKYSLSPDKFYVQYAGNFGFTFNYKYVIDVATVLKNNTRIVFQMIGEGAFLDSFKSEVEERGLQNIVFLPWQPIDIISDVYSAADVSLIPLSKGVINNSFPSKGSLLMACGKVIICATEVDSSYYKFINDSGVGFCVSNTNYYEAAERIEYLFNNKNILLDMGRKAIDFGKLNYSSDACLPRFKTLITKYKKENSDVYV